MAGLEPNWSLYCLFLEVVGNSKGTSFGVKVWHWASKAFKVPFVATLTLLWVFGGLGGELYEPRVPFRSKHKGC